MNDEVEYLFDEEKEMNSKSLKVDKCSNTESALGSLEDEKNSESNFSEDKGLKKDKKTSKLFIPFNFND